MARRIVTQQADPSSREIADDLSSAGFVDARVSGRGGFGVVYRCRQPALDRDVAVKVLRAGRDDTDRVRFLREQHRPWAACRDTPTSSTSSRPA